MIKQSFNDNSKPLKWEDVLPSLELPLQPCLPEPFPAQNDHETYIRNNPGNVDQMGTTYGRFRKNRKQKPGSTLPN